MFYLGQNDDSWDYAEHEEPLYERTRRLKLELMAANDQLERMKEELYQYGLELKKANI